MKLFVGLGNPGGGYAKHRHNVGFMAADRIAGRHGFSQWKGKFSAQLAEGRLGGEKCLLLKPMTFMNASGQAVGEAMRFYKLAPGDVTVFYDELDLAPGKVRVKSGGGAAGHNGIRSIAKHIGEDFTRVRIGIGHPGNKAKVQGYVLRDFSKADQDWLEPLLDAIADAAPRLASDDASSFMNVCALAVQGAEPTKTSETRPAPARKPARTAGKAEARKRGGAPSQREMARRAAQSSAISKKKSPKSPSTARPADTAAKADDDNKTASPFARLKEFFSGGKD